MDVRVKSENSNKKTVVVTASAAKKGRTSVSVAKFSPSWVVVNPKDAPGIQMELIGRIREGVKKTDWKQLIHYLGSTEKEFEHILPASISSLQKKLFMEKKLQSQSTRWRDYSELVMRFLILKKISRNG